MHHTVPKPVLITKPTLITEICSENACIPYLGRIKCPEYILHINIFLYLEPRLLVHNSTIE